MVYPKMIKFGRSMLYLSGTYAAVCTDVGMLNVDGSEIEIDPLRVKLNKPFVNSIE
jgi:hypothetical protein